MSRTIRGARDDVLQAVSDALVAYEREHPHAVIELYRRNSVSIHIRVIDPDFADLDRLGRHHRVWACFEPLSEEIQSEITILLLLTPDETRKSYANVEFENPVSSSL